MGARACVTAVSTAPLPLVRSRSAPKDGLLKWDRKNGVLEPGIYHDAR